MLPMKEQMEIDIKEIFDKIPGMIAEEEGKFLYQLAYQCTKGEIVEIGASAGRSTACLARGSQAAKAAMLHGGRKVFSIDPHNGGGATPDPTWYDAGDDGTPDPKYYINQRTSLEEFQKRIVDLKIDDTVIPIPNYSEIAYKTYVAQWKPLYPAGIQLLFIDGDHRYNYVKMDLELWGRHLIPGATVLMHDSTYVGVRRVIDNLIKNSGRYTNISEGPIFNTTLI